MRRHSREHTLDFLLDFDGRVHRYEDGCYAKFEIRRIAQTPERPHGLRYSFTLHDPDGVRLLGFDNTHKVSRPGSRFGPRPEIADHWHRTKEDEGRPYEYEGAETLIEDFFNEIARVLVERGVSLEIVAVEE